MKPRELDRAIAIHVMNTEFTWESKMKDIPKYSTDLVQAMKVFDVLRESHKWCCLTMTSDYCYSWIVKLTPAFHRRLKDGVDVESQLYDADNHKPTVVAEDESLPRAICIVALKSIDYEFGED